MTFRCLRGVADVDAGCLWSGDGPIFRAFSMALWFPAAPISRSARSAPCPFPWLLLIDVPFRRTRWFRFVRTSDTFHFDRGVEEGVERVDLARALERLSSADRQALFLYFYLDLPVDEVGVALGISAAAAKGRIYRACHRLRPDLAQEDL